MKTVTVELSKPVEMFNKPVPRIVLREPSYRTYAQLGEPWAVSRTPDGAQFAAARDDVIASYVEKCIYDPNNEFGGDAVLSMIDNLKDSRALRNAVLDFFRDTDAATSGAAPA